jgi:hypothetical protein
MVNSKTRGVKNNIEQREIRQLSWGLLKARQPLGIQKCGLEIEDGSHVLLNHWPAFPEPHLK